LVAALNTTVCLEPTIYVIFNNVADWHIKVSLRCNFNFWSELSLARYDMFIKFDDRTLASWWFRGRCTEGGLQPFRKNHNASQWMWMKVMVVESKERESVCWPRLTSRMCGA
jgi:hypothetical protein